MVKKLLIIALALVLLSPMLGLVGIAVLMNPAAGATCTVNADGSVTIGEVPDELTVDTADGQQVTLGREQLSHAATIIENGSGIDGVGRDGIQIALMAALTESSLRMLANSTVPGSEDHPNDGVGSDNDSLGLFQMRPSTGWGSVEELMDSQYQAQAFFGGPDGPNAGSPPRAARHPQLGRHGQGPGGAGGRGQRLPRPLPELRTGSRDHPRYPHRHDHERR